MNVVSLTHGSFFMLGAYVGYSVVQATGNFYLAVLVAPIPVAILAIVIERGFLRRLYQRGHLDQVLLTFGFTYVLADVVKFIWGSELYSINPPDAFADVTQMFGAVFPSYRLFLIVLGLVIAITMWLVLDRSRIGAIVRASVDDRAMAEGVGINVSLLFTVTFVIGAWLAAIAGVVAAPVLGVSPGMDAEVLIPAFIVIVIGGTGNIKGALVGSLLVGQADTFGKAYWPDASLFIIYVLMIVILLSRPFGLFGIKRFG
jgi:branched-subunit amino acid ABC-type transport system permease component